MPITLPRVPNGVAFSCRKRARQSRQNTTDRAREAVSCNAVFGADADYVTSDNLILDTTGIIYCSCIWFAAR